jgi:hypothetical protein
MSSTSAVIKTALEGEVDRPAILDLGDPLPRDFHLTTREFQLWDTLREIIIQGTPFAREPVTLPPQGPRFYVFGDLLARYQHDVEVDQATLHRAAAVQELTERTAVDTPWSTLLYSCARVDRDGNTVIPVGAPLDSGEDIKFSTNDKIIRCAKKRRVFDGELLVERRLDKGYLDMPSVPLGPSNHARKQAETYGTLLPESTDDLGPLEMQSVFVMGSDHSVTARGEIHGTEQKAVIALSTSASTSRGTVITVFDPEKTRVFRLGSSGHYTGEPAMFSGGGEDDSAHQDYFSLLDPWCGMPRVIEVDGRRRELGITPGDNVLASASVDFSQIASMDPVQYDKCLKAMLDHLVGKMNPTGQTSWTHNEIKKLLPRVVYHVEGEYGDYSIPDMDTYLVRLFLSLHGWSYYQIDKTTSGGRIYGIKESARPESYATLRWKFLPICMTKRGLFAYTPYYSTLFGLFRAFVPSGHGTLGPRLSRVVNSSTCPPDNEVSTNAVYLGFSGACQPYENGPLWGDSESSPYDYLPIAVAMLEAHDRARELIFKIGHIDIYTNYTSAEDYVVIILNGRRESSVLFASKNGNFTRGDISLPFSILSKNISGYGYALYRFSGIPP